LFVCKVAFGRCRQEALLPLADLHDLLLWLGYPSPGWVRITSSRTKLNDLASRLRQIGNTRELAMLLIGAACPLGSFRNCERWLQIGSVASPESASRAMARTNTRFDSTGEGSGTRLPAATLKALRAIGVATFDETNLSWLPAGISSVDWR
jgi:hypothetical protein